MPVRPRPEIEGLSACEHGGFLVHGGSQRRTIDFSVCCNPYAPLPGLKAASGRARYDVYPDSDCTALRAALSRATGLRPGRIMAGSGSMELIRLAALAYVRSGDPVLLPRPTFGEYRIACTLMGAGVREHALSEGGAFRIDAQRLAAEVKRLRPRLLFLCNPNNPTGWYLDREDVELVLEACGDTLLVLDEAYAGFTEDPWESAALLEGGNLLIVRSMTKDYGMAGLRLGYAMGREDVIQNLRRACPPWNVSAPAQAAGVYAVEKGGSFLQCSKARLARAKEELLSALERLGMAPIRSQANFFLLKVGDGRAFRERLLERGLAVRDCASFGLPEYVRIGVRSAAENRRLVAAIREEALVQTLAPNATGRLLRGSHRCRQG